jgi:hypothetical protein
LCGPLSSLRNEVWLEGNALRLIRWQTWWLDLCNLISWEYIYIWLGAVLLFRHQVTIMEFGYSHIPYCDEWTVESLRALYRYRFQIIQRFIWCTIQHCAVEDKKFRVLLYIIVELNALSFSSMKLYFNKSGKYFHNI